MPDKILFRTSPCLRREYLLTFIYAAPLLVARYLAPYNEIVSAVLLMLLLAVIARLIWALIRVSCTEYRITDQYVELAEGIVARKLKRAPWLKITNFTSEQSALDRLLGMADVRVDTPGHDQWEVEYTSVTLAEASQILALLEEYVPDAKGPEEERKGDPK